MLICGSKLTETWIFQNNRMHSTFLTHLCSLLGQCTATVICSPAHNMWFAVLLTICDLQSCSQYVIMPYTSMSTSPFHHVILSCSSKSIFCVSTSPPHHVILHQCTLTNVYITCKHQSYSQYVILPYSSMRTSPIHHVILSCSSMSTLLVSPSPTHHMWPYYAHLCLYYMFAPFLLTMWYCPAHQCLYCMYVPALLTICNLLMIINVHSTCEHQSYSPYAILPYSPMSILHVSTSSTHHTWSCHAHKCLLRGHK